MKMRVNFTNILVVVAKMFEFWSLTSLSFRPEINWGLTYDQLWKIDILNTEIPRDSYVGMFETGFVSCIIFTIIMYKITLRIRSSIYGQVTHIFHILERI